MKSNLRVKLIWILMQGVFLPLVLWLDSFRESGQYLLAGGIFVLLEALYLVDAIIFLRIFRKED